MEIAKESRNKNSGEGKEPAVVEVNNAGSEKFVAVCMQLLRVRCASAFLKEPKILFADTGQISQCEMFRLFKKNLFSRWKRVFCHISRRSCAYIVYLRAYFLSLGYLFGSTQNKSASKADFIILFSACFHAYGQRVCVCVHM